MFSAYFDESYDGTGDMLWAIAGWIAEESNWELFNCRWDEVLCRYCAPMFHASECEGQHDTFKNWDKDECNALRDSLIEVIELSKLVGVSCAINVKEAPEISRRPEPYFYCMQYCLVEAFRRIPDGEKLRIIFGRHVGANGKAQEIIKLLRKCKYFDEADRISSEPPKPGLNKEIFGLQAADLLAYETYRDARSKMDKSLHVRTQFSRLQTFVLASQYFNGSEVEMLISERQQLERG